MYKWIQLSLVAIGLLVTIGLFNLPKVIVNNPEKNDNLSKQNAEKQSTEEQPTHTRTLNNEQSQQLNKLKTQLAQAQNNSQKINTLDSVVAFFTQVNWLDSAGVYTEQIARLEPSVANWMKTGNSYYEAFSFAMTQDKANVLGEKAREYFQKVLESNPGNLDAKTKMGMTFVATKNPMQGINLLLEVVAEDPDNELALFNLGILSMERGAPDKAVGRFEKLLSVNPKNVQAWLYLAESYEALKNKAKAIEALESAKKLDLSPEMKTQIDNYLQTLRN